MEQTTEYILYPKTVLQMANQLKKICDNYWNGKIELEELVLMLNTLNSYKKFYDKKINIFNPSIKKIIGAKRRKLIIEAFN